MRIFIIGNNGQLGRDMVATMTNAGHTVSGADHPAIDITQKESIRTILTPFAPDLIINCAAFTAVDDCEVKYDVAYAVNATGVGLIGECATELNAAVAHISTDYVFDGEGSRPYLETDPCAPKSAYGKGKLDGEKLLAAACKRHYIFRIAWLYGENGNNFVKTIRKVALAKAAAGETMKVVNDQFGTPTSTLDVCRQINTVIATENYGIFHCTSEGSCTWYDFAVEITRLLNIGDVVRPCTTEEFPRPAPRPHYSVLENGHLKAINLNIMPEWRAGLAAFFKSVEGRNIWG